MEKKTFKIVKNILFPFKSVIEIGPDGITNKGKLVRWDEMKDFSFHIQSINGSMNYNVAYGDVNGKQHRLAFTHALTAKRAKKETFWEMYSMIEEGFMTHHILPQSKAFAEQVRNGQELELAKAKITKDGVTVRKGLVKKESVFIPNEDVRIGHREGSGGFDVYSAKNRKDMGFYQYAVPESRFLLATLEILYPQHETEMAVDAPGMNQG